MRVLSLFAGIRGFDLPRLLLRPASRGIGDIVAYTRKAYKNFFFSFETRSRARARERHCRNRPGGPVRRAMPRSARAPLVECCGDLSEPVPHRIGIVLHHEAANLGGQIGK